MSELQTGELLALATALLWTFSSLAWTSAGRRIGALAVSFIRLVIAAAFMIAYCRIARNLWLPTDADARTWLLMGASGFFGFFLCDICLFKSMLLIGPRLTLLLFSLSPPIAAVISWVFIDDKLMLLQWIAMAVTLAGIAWVVMERPNGQASSHSPRHHWQGITLGVLASLANGIGMVLSKEGIGHGQYDAMAATLIRAIVALPGYIVLITLWRRWPAMLAGSRDLRAVGILTFGAVVGPFIGVALSLVAFQHAPTGVVATIIATMPIMILPFSILLYREKVSLRAVGGAIVAVAGIAMLMLPQQAVAKIAEEKPAGLVFCCQAGNDLYRAIGGEKIGSPRFATPVEAVQAAAEGAGVLLLADGYPEKRTVVAPAVLDQATKKHLRLYVEFPADLPGVQFGPPAASKLERGVVASKFFGQSLPPMRIVMINGCRYLPLTGGTSPLKSHLVLARVAGVDMAVFGLKDTPTQPILFDHPRGNLLVATTKLSHFVTGRYMPQAAWRTIWETILTRLQPGVPPPPLAWTPTVRPSFGRDEPLPADVELQALHRSADWIMHARILRHPKWPQEVLDRALHYNTVRDMPSADWPSGDGSLGILEGYSSTIRADGSQPMRYAVRNDNMCEVAMLLAFDATTRPRPQHRAIAVNLLDYIFLKSGLALGNRANPASPEYGLVGWSFDYPNSYWSDDNARSMLSLLAASALLNANAGRGGRDSWGGSLTATPTTNLSFSLDDAVTRCVLANFRTTGVYGFREDMITAEDLQKSGWRHYWDAGNTRFSPHYAGWLWPCYLWAYEKTHFEPFLSRSETAMRMLLQAYPDRWYWTDRSGSIERARALLPLAWLVRVHDTPEHRGWLRRVAGDLIALQDASGAIRETIGGGGHGTVSNAEYGTCETSLIQSDGDPIADMLYTCNFALIGLHEAAAATGEPLYAAAEEKLAKFLCRIQIRSDGDCPNFRANENGTVPFAGHPELDGAWYRAFDFRNWEYWASNADWEWGPWCTETGWTQPWIAGTLALRHKKTSLWDLARQAPISKNFARLRREMLPDEQRRSGRPFTPPTVP
jgi:drug/metabolite transporter (DMT)-like permease